MDYFDILTEDGDRTGIQASRHELYCDGVYHGSVHIWVVSDGNILLKKQGTGKKRHTGKWSMACSDCIEASETPLETAQRLMINTFSIKSEPQELKLLFVQKIHNKNENFINNEINYVYCATEPFGYTKIKNESDNLVWKSRDAIEKGLVSNPRDYSFSMEEYSRFTNSCWENRRRVNFHTHTYRCKHAQGTEEDCVREAIEKGVDVLGFSDHAPFPNKDYGLRMTYTELPVYIAEIERLMYKYGGKIRLFKGLEIEYIDSMEYYYYDLLSIHGLDYLAVGEHFFEGSEGFENIFSDGKDTDVFVRYALAVERALKTNCFSFVAHPDIMFIRDFPWDDNCERACDIIINAALKHDTVLEYNANGYRRGKMRFNDSSRYPYPHKTFWEKVAKTDIRVLVGSDCHAPAQVYDAYMERAVLYAEEAGLNVVDEF